MPKPQILTTGTIPLSTASALELEALPLRTSTRLSTRTHVYTPGWTKSLLARIDLCTIRTTPTQYNLHTRLWQKARPSLKAKRTPTRPRPKTASSLETLRSRSAMRKTSSCILNQKRIQYRNRCKWRITFFSTMKQKLPALLFQPLFSWERCTTQIIPLA